MAALFIFPDLGKMVIEMDIKKAESSSLAFRLS